MEKAARLLLEPRSRVESVGAAVGYSSAKNFARAFKAFYRVTPREYRLGAAGKDAAGKEAAGRVQDEAGSDGRASASVPSAENASDFR